MKNLKRSVSIVLLLAVLAVAWYFARPGDTGELKTAKPLTAFEKATQEKRPVLVMFTSDT